MCGFPLKANLCHGPLTSFLTSPRSSNSVRFCHDPTGSGPGSQRPPPSQMPVWAPGRLLTNQLCIWGVSTAPPWVRYFAGMTHRAQTSAFVTKNTTRGQPNGKRCTREVRERGADFPHPPGTNPESPRTLLFGGFCDVFIR